MFRFIKKCFFIGSLFLSNLVSTTALSCISMNNLACKARTEIINVNSNNPIFYANVVVIVIVIMIHLQKYLFRML